MKCWSDRQRTPLRDGNHFGNDPQLVPGFPSTCSGMFPERFRKSVCACGLKRNSSNLNRALKIRDSVLLNSWNSLLVMYSSTTPTTNVFCDWLFLVISCVSLETTANFSLFLSAAILPKEKSQQLVKTDLIFYFLNEFLRATEYSFFFNEELDFNHQQTTELQKGQY